MLSGMTNTIPNAIPKLSRRAMLAGVPATFLLGGLARAAQGPKRPKLAAIVTEWRYRSHAQNIVDRFLEGYGWKSAWHRPAMDVVAVYTDQVPPNDLSRERARRIPKLRIYPTIAEALTLGGEKLAVDGVIVVGEHGDYPQNEKGQWLYPRYEFFRQIVDVFRASGRSVPVFNDKHLSWNFDRAVEMVEASRSLGFAFRAGSSLPVTWRIPSVELPPGAEVDEVVGIGPGKVDSYDFHVLELIQSMVERRRGGETGVATVEALRGGSVWQALSAGSWEGGGCNRELFDACLCRSFTLKPGREDFSHVFPTAAQMAELVPDPVAYRIEYADGLKATMLLLDGLVGDMNFAARVKGRETPLSTQMYLGVAAEMMPNYFNPLVHHIETMFLTGQAPYPIERTLLTTGLVAAGVESLWRKQRIETPHLAIKYEPTKESTYRVL